MEKGYVYLILEVDQEGLEKHKIGISKNEPDARLQNLKTGNPNHIRILNKYLSVNYKKIEKLLHKKYSNQKTIANNEWFYLFDSQVISFVSECEKMDKIVSVLKNSNHFYK